MTRFDLTSCIGSIFIEYTVEAIEVVLKVVAISFRVTTLFNPFCMAPVWIVMYPGGSFDTSNVTECQYK